MPDKFRRCGNGCLRCWRNKLKHGVHKSSSMDFKVIKPEPEPKPDEPKLQPKSMTIREIRELWSKGKILESDTEQYLDILLDRKPTKDTNYLIKVLSRSIHIIR